MILLIGTLFVTNACFLAGFCTEIVWRLVEPHLSLATTFKLKLLKNEIKLKAMNALGYYDSFDQVITDDGRDVGRAAELLQPRVGTLEVPAKSLLASLDAKTLIVKGHCGRGRPFRFRLDETTEPLVLLPLIENLKTNPVNLPKVLTAGAQIGDHFFDITDAYHAWNLTCFSKGAVQIEQVFRDYLEIDIRAAEIVLESEEDEVTFELLHAGLVMMTEKTRLPLYLFKK